MPTEGRPTTKGEVFRKLKYRLARECAVGPTTNGERNENRTLGHFECIRSWYYHGRVPGFRGPSALHSPTEPSRAAECARWRDRRQWWPGLQHVGYHCCQ